MIFILIIIAIFLLDNKIKNYIEDKKEMHKKEKILKDKIILNRYHNKGAFLGIFEKNINFVKVLSSVILGLLLLFFLIILPKKNKKAIKLALSLILAGAASNTYDRHKRGYVVDYFSFNFKPLKNIIFNISDICIFIGAAILLIASGLNKGD